MATMPTLLAGELPDANKWAAILAQLPRTVVKTADDTRTSTTYTADTHLTMSVPAAGTYTFQIMLIYNGPTGGANGRLKVRINFPSGAVSWGHFGGKNNTAVVDANMTDIDLGAQFNDTSSPTNDILFPTVNTTVELLGFIVGTLRASASGTFSIDTAQIVASGTTTIRTDSSLTMTLVAA